MPDPYPTIAWAWIALAIVWLVASFNSKRTVQAQPLSSRLAHLGILVVAGLLLSGNLPWNFLGFTILPKSLASANTGMFMTLAGCAFALWARLVLGRNWSGSVTLKQDHELIRSGPYSIVRHPIYSALLLALLGTAIARGDIGALIGLVIFTASFRAKSATEESYMVRQFGTAYTVYRSEVKSLIPFVW